MENGVQLTSVAWIAKVHMKKSIDTLTNSHWRFVFSFAWIWGKFGWKIWFCKICNFAKAVRHFSSDDRRIVNCRKIIVNSKWITVPMIESSHDYEPLIGFVLFLIFFCFLFCLFFVCLCIDECYTEWLSGPFKIWKKLVDVTKQLFIGESNLRTFQGTEICRKYGTSKNKISDKN